MVTPSHIGILGGIKGAIELQVRLRIAVAHLGLDKPVMAYSPREGALLGHLGQHVAWLECWKPNAPSLLFLLASFPCMCYFQ